MRHDLSGLATVGEWLESCRGIHRAAGLTLRGGVAS